MQNYDVIIIGGGAVGSAVARELTARGETPFLIGSCESGEKGVDVLW